MHWLALTESPAARAGGSLPGRVVLALSLILLLVGGCRPSAPRHASGPTSPQDHWQDFLPTASQPDSEAVTPIATEPSVDETRPATTVGSSSCAECHPDQASSYQATSHYRSARWIQDSHGLPPVRFTHQPSGRSYEVAQENGSLVHSEKILGAGGQLIASDSADLVLEMGSGLHAHSYLTQRDGFWIQSPLTWYSQPQKWDLSPGYDPTTQATFDRVVTTDCVFCHVGRIRMHNDDIHRFSIEEVSIGCERCHGPAQQHVAARRAAEGRPDALPAVVAGDADGGPEIINPLSLSRESQEAVCSQCHLQGIVFARSDGFDRWDFVPGQLMSDSITQYQLEGVDEQFRIVGHTEQLHQSACYLQTESLTCTTCHDPHAPPPSRAEYRQVCIDCHQSDGCSVAEADRIRTQNDDCSVCHMPIRPTNVTHAALHDHRITVHDLSYTLASIQPPVSADRPSPGRSQKPRLVAISDQSSLEPWRQQRRWALAMHALAFGGTVPTELPEFDRAKKQLLDLHRKGISDPGMEVSLAKDYLESNMLAPANQLAKKVVAQTVAGQRSYLGAADVLGQLALRTENNQSALKWYRQLTKLRRVAGDSFLVGLCESNAGNQEAAIEAFLQALEIDPTLVAAHQHLANLLRETGDKRRSQLHQQAIRAIRAQSRQGRIAP